MGITVVLMCLVLQRFLHLNSYSHQFNWMTPYFDWIKAKVPQVMEGQGWLGTLIVILPVLVAVWLVFMLTRQLLGVVGYYVLNVAFLWYCLDSRDLHKEPYKPESPGHTIKMVYQGLFSIIFWFFLLGGVGVALYISVRELNKLKALPFAAQVQGALDWVPVRLLGLSFALVGNFSGVFTGWVKDLLGGIDEHYEHLVKWGNAALQDGDDPIALLDRSLLLWLAVMAIFTIGFWMGLL